MGFQPGLFRRASLGDILVNLRKAEAKYCEEEKPRENATEVTSAPGRARRREASVIRHDLPPTPKGLVGVWKEIDAILCRQAVDPNYQYVAPLPNNS
jgi:hypothetical protein